MLGWYVGTYTYWTLRNFREENLGKSNGILLKEGGGKGIVRYEGTYLPTVPTQGISERKIWENPIESH